MRQPACAFVSAELLQPCLSNLFKTPSPGNTDAAFINIISRSRAKASKTDSGKWRTTSKRDPIHISRQDFF